MTAIDCHRYIPELLKDNKPSLLFGDRSGERGSESWRWNMTILSGVHNEAHFG